MPRAIAAPLLALVCASGCQMLALNPGRLEALNVAGQVGKFRQLKGQWPGTAKDLDEFPLVEEFDEVDLGDGKEVRQPPNRIELKPRGENLRVEIYDAANRRICRLDLLAPHFEDTAVVIPMIVVKTSVFSCPGEGEKFR